MALQQGTIHSISILLLALLPLALALSSGSHGHHDAVARRLAGNQIIDGAPNALTHNLTRREDYTCGPGRPCGNHACCGKDGFCGYGATYCGTGCTSNCDAHAECGKDALPAGKTCPLNVCCSEFGFCGSTTDFCTGKCQSNCVEHPSPPGGSPTGQVLNRVVGYYEAWNAASACRKTLPRDLPLDALTHVNFAFTSLDPSSYMMTPMDGSIPPSLFLETTQLKERKPGLQVWASLGGWTFSDNGTVTQPLLGTIARDPAKRQKFADNMLRFLDNWAFDGIDIDWEYPGAPDRGGNADDVANYVLLMQTLRNTLNKSSRRLGISFTIPASFWYLRWFDMPGLMKYADFTNLMSYDIHGTWDKENAIGNVIHPHTNLTEIKLAVELLWRVGVKPSQVGLGFGFYGRSYTLANPSCKTPGKCPFSTGGKPGPCTATSGYLAYYEIQDVLAKNPGIQVIHDQTAAVKYFSWNNDQWIAYDDADTFKQKVDWANSVGFSGSLIWASDLDDNSFSAHKALLGRPVKANSQLTTNSITTQIGIVDLNGSLNGNCQRIDTCLSTTIDGVIGSYCRSTQVLQGWDKSNCPKNFAKPICCGALRPPKSCTWRGGGLDCNGRCHAGEVNLFQSNNGGEPGESGTSNCNRGHKVFCCVLNELPQLIKDCRWTSCGGGCNGDENEITKSSVDGRGNVCGYVFSTTARFCCKGQAPLKDCHWVGKGDCADNTCDASEVALQTNPFGEPGSWSCNWERHKSLCCTPQINTDPFICTKKICDSIPFFCPSDSQYEWDVGVDPDDSQWPQYPSKRDLGDDHVDDHVEDVGIVNITSATDLEILDPRSLLLPRGSARRPERVDFWDAFRFLQVVIYIYARAYPGPSRLYDTANGAQAFRWAIRPRGGQCDTTDIEFVDARVLMPRPDLYGFQNDHPIELQYMADLLETIATGILPSGNPTTGNRVIPFTTIDFYWRSRNLPNNLPPPTPNTKANFLNINDRFFEILGSLTNRAPFRMLDRDMNNMKGRIFGGSSPIAQDRMTTWIRDALATGQGEENFLQPLRMVFAIYRYLFDPNVEPQIQQQRRQMRDQAAAIAAAVPALAPLALIWVDFDRDYFQHAADFARGWVRDQIQNAYATVQLYVQANPNNPPANAQRIVQQLQALWFQLNIIRAFGPY